LPSMDERYLSQHIKRDLGKKIVLLSGPRQVGKTTLAKALSPVHSYVNFDVPEHRKTLIERSWRRDVELVIFDELHKMKNWKSWLKGIYDGEGLIPPILVTGSARLDIARRMGDSLAGRHFLFHLHPCDLKELKHAGPQPFQARQALERLMRVGGFPEPFFSEDPLFAQRWRRSHQDMVLRQDAIDLEQIRQITQLETLVELLRERVGSPVSAQSLAEDLNVNDTTVRRWLAVLENLLVVFKVSPFHRSIARSLKKAPKYYFFDNGLVRGDDGVLFENALACALLKEVHFQRDAAGRELELRYLRNRDGDELDFAVVENGALTRVFEAKWSDDDPARGFGRLIAKEDLASGRVQAMQLVANNARERDMPSGVKVRDAASVLAELKL
jgi:uncharacterized protein